MTIDTRDKLKAYDAELAKLLTEVYGDREWRYIRPAQRAASERKHLEGFDPLKAPRFQWPTTPATQKSAGETRE